MYVCVCCQTDVGRTSPLNVIMLSCTRPSVRLSVCVGEVARPLARAVSSARPSDLCTRVVGAACVAEQGRALAGEQTTASGCLHTVRRRGG